ncbi:demethylmenaquinone methyltransferase [Nonomuraea sp. NPDC047897]|jgi:demethylmenaquinone methyltransferase/2-methoxy-6-polyprenyl-1,4-benzoquinol methylase|uniref:demethylmenaquinone methyltransferase n=1 Tax=Nonomuraea sp. NPDC047897 TaxID=3364346 RepID=UPI00371E9357
MTRAQLDKKPGEVAAMFDRTARRYDLVNDVISLGQVRLWRRAVARAVDAGPGEVVLDLGAGTGTSTDTFTTLGARAIASDFSLGMLRTGVRRHGGNALSGPGVPFVAGDAMRLPFADDSFDAVTISVALRNVHDTGQALREMLRVTKPGGRLVVMEFSHVTVPAFDLVYREYLMKLLPRVATVFGSNDDSYAYLAESIRDWPDQATLARLIRESGWERVAWRNLTMGIVAMHRAVKPV